MDIKNFIRDEDFPEYWLNHSVNLCGRYSDVCIMVDDGSKEFNREYLIVIENNVPT